MYTIIRLYIIILIYIIIFVFSCYNILFKIEEISVDLTYVNIINLTYK